MKNCISKNLIVNFKKLICFSVLLLSCILLCGCGSNTEKIGVDSIEISKKNLYMAEGQTAVISAQVYPFNASNQNYTFESSNDSVVSIEDGFLTAKKAGDAVIYVYSDDGGYQDSCNVLVTKASDNLALNGYNNLNMPPKELEPIYDNESNGQQINTSVKNNKQKRYTAKNLSNKQNKNNTYVSSKNKKYDPRVSNEFNKNINAISNLNNQSRSFKNLLKRKLKQVNAEVQDDVQTGKNVIEDLKLELQNSIKSLNAEKDMILNDMPKMFANDFTEAFNNIRCDMIDMMTLTKQSILDDLNKAEENLETGEYSVESKNLNGVTFVVIKNNINSNDENLDNSADTL